MAPDADLDREQLLKEIAALRVELAHTRRQVTSEALERSEASLRNAQRIARLGSWEVDSRTGVNHWSDEYYRLCGIKPGTEVNYAFFLSLVHPEDRARIAEIVETGYRTGKPFTVDYRVIREPGDIRHFRGQGEAEFDADGGPIRMSGTAQDITEQHQIEETLAGYREHLEELVEDRTRELKASQHRLAESDRMASLGTLAAGIAHQINNPIAVILLAAQYGKLSEKDPTYPEVARQVIDDIAIEARRCGDIVQSVLQFARGESTDRWPDDLNAAVQRACIVTGQYAGEHNASLEFELPQEPLPVRMNPLEIEQVLINLIRNAVESKSSGAHIRVRAHRAGDRVRVEISDDGRGLDEAEQKRIFDPFYTTRLNDGGTGLGLSIAHGTIRGHAGTLSVESTPGGGTTFIVDLPSSNA